MTSYHGEGGPCDECEQKLARALTALSRGEAIEDDPNKHPVWLDRKRPCQHCGASGETAQWVDGPRTSDIRDLCRRCWPGPIVEPAHHPEAGAPSREEIARVLFDRMVGRTTQDQAVDAILALFPTPPDKAVLGGMGEREGVAEQLRVEAGHAKPGFGRLLLKAAQLLSERPAATTPEPPPK